MGWLSRCPGIVWEPIRKQVHTQLVREHLVTVVSAHWATVDWSWHKSGISVRELISTLKKRKKRRRGINCPTFSQISRTRGKSHYHFKFMFRHALVTVWVAQFQKGKHLSLCCWSYPLAPTRSQFSLPEPFHVSVQSTRTYLRVSSVYQDLFTCQVSLLEPIHVSIQSTGTYSYVSSVYQDLLTCQFDQSTGTYPRVGQSTITYTRVSSFYQNLFTCQFTLPEPIHVSCQWTRTYLCVSSVYHNFLTCQVSLPEPNHVSDQSTRNYSCVSSVYQGLSMCQFSLPGFIHVSVQSTSGYLCVSSVYQGLSMCQFSLPGFIYVSVQSTGVYLCVGSVY